jgi:hypothetical protein
MMIVGRLNPTKLLSNCSRFISLQDVWCRAGEGSRTKETATVVAHDRKLKEA